MDQEHTPFFDRLDEYRNTPLPPSDWRPQPRAEGEEDAPAVSPAELLDNGREMRRTYSRVALGLFLFILIPQVLILLLGLLAGMAAPELLDSMLFQMILSDGCMYLVGAPICLLVVGIPRLKSKATPEKMTPLVFLAALAIFEFLSVLGSLLGQGLMSALSALVGYDYASMLDSTVDGLSLPAVFIFLVIIAPICEEIIFRKLPLDRLAPYGEWQAILFSATVFGLAHGNFFQLFYCFAGGIIFAYLYTRTRKLIYPILMHMFFNFTGGFLPTLIERAAGEESILMALFSIVMMLIAFLGLVAFVLVCILRPFSLRRAEIPLPPEKQMRTRFLNGGMLALFATLILLLLVSLIPVRVA